MPRNRNAAGKWGNVNERYLTELSRRGASDAVLTAENVIDINEHLISCALLGKPADWPDLARYDYQTRPYVDTPNWSVVERCVLDALPHVNALHSYWNNSFSSQIKEAILLLAELVPKTQEFSEGSDDYLLYWNACQTAREVWRCGLIYLTWSVLPKLLEDGWYVGGNLAAKLKENDLPKFPSDIVTVPQTPDVDLEILSEFNSWRTAREALLKAEDKFLEEIGKLLTEYDVLVTKK